MTPDHEACGIALERIPGSTTTWIGSDGNLTIELDGPNANGVWSAAVRLRPGAGYRLFTSGASAEQAIQRIEQSLETT